jgi:hypothetical protein
MEKVSNLVMKNGNFIKFIYSDPDCTMNSLFVEIPIKIASVENDPNAAVATAVAPKKKLLFDTSAMAENSEYIRAFYHIERAILDSYSGFVGDGKKPIYKIFENMFHGNIYVCDTPSINNSTANKKLIIKMSGIWESVREYGITYRFILV